ncbi:MAG: aldo/keto reductase [bacterium]|nr:aldo/keto reductase [bacterium]
MTHITLNTGAKMPFVGLGTWKAPPNEVGKAVEYALLDAGYRHIDCAAIYRNEKEIGETFAKIFSEGRVKREEVFITSKLWNTEHAKKDVLAACKLTLESLKLDYLDLYLMHWGLATAPDDTLPIKNARGESLDENGCLRTIPVSVRETWEAMGELVKAGLVRAIGLANFTAPMIVDLLSYAKIVPAVNQIELHPYNQQMDLVLFCQSKGIVVTAYSPLGTSGNLKDRPDEPILINDPKITAIAKAYNKSPAQILIRWAVQRNTIVIPKSLSPEHLKANIDVFNFELSPQDMADIATLDRGHRFVNPSKAWKIPYFC